MYAQIDSSGYCFAVSDYNAQGAIKVSGVDVLGKVYQDGEWLDPPQEEQPEPVDDLAEIKEQNTLIMMALAELYERGETNG